MQVDNNMFVTMSTRYQGIMSNVLDKHAPVRTRTNRATEPQWIDQEYRRCRAVRRKYEKLWKRTRTDTNKTNYINPKQLCNELVISKQSEHYNKLIENAGTCQKSLFKIANNLLDKTKVKILPSYNDPKQLARLQYIFCG